MYFWLCLPLILFNREVQAETVKPKVYTVEIKEMKFLPTVIQVKKGDTIVWINRDMVPHNVTEEKQKAWASPLLPVGKSWKMVVQASGAYFCSLHPVMKGRIQVQ